MSNTPPKLLRTLAKQRSQFYQAIRTFLNEQNFVETETPLLSEHLIPESCIEVFQTEWRSHFGQQQTLFLTPSPEIYMKSLISQGIGDCYQLTKSFRNAEEPSQRHLSEFTMLEWYVMGKDYRDNIRLTQSLLTSLAPLAASETKAMFTDFMEVTMAQLFLDYVQIDLEQATTLEAFKSLAEQAEFQDYARKSESWEALFNFIFVGHVENKLPQNKTVFITNYPAQIPTTAKKAGQHYERWEFYMNGWEIANCYTEETQYDAMRQLFEEEGALKQEMLVPHPVNLEYLSIFNTEEEQPFPNCSGVALGVDRLFAVAQNAGHLSEVCLCE